MAHFNFDWLHWFALGLALGVLGMSIFQFAMFCRRQAADEFRRLAREQREKVEKESPSEDGGVTPCQHD